MLRTAAFGGSLLKASLRLSASLFTNTPVMSDQQNVENVGEAGVAGEKKISGDFRPDYPWKRAKKCAAMLSFSGKNYYGMQRNNVGELKTIESELLAALAKAGQIDPLWEHAPAKAFFSRASRTDKGVSALRMVVSCKMLQDRASNEGPRMFHKVENAY